VRVPRRAPSRATPPRSPGRTLRRAASPTQARRHRRAHPRGRMMHYLTDPWHFGFSRHALIAGILAGGLCGLVGVYVVLRRMSYIGHGLSHAIFGGAVASYVVKVNFYAGAGLWGLVSAMLINSVSRRRKIGADAAIGVVT